MHIIAGVAEASEARTSDITGLLVEKVIDVNKTSSGEADAK